MAVGWSSCAGDHLYRQQDLSMVPPHPPPLCNPLALHHPQVCFQVGVWIPDCEGTGWTPPAHLSLYNTLKRCNEHFWSFT